MIIYNPDIEVFQDFVNFNKDSPCIWVVYPAGAAGDMFSTIINFHYVNTSASYYGINENGQIIFRPSDFKFTNQLHNQNKLSFNEEFFKKIEDILSSKNTNFSLLDQFIFSNHCYENHNVELILDTFPNAKIIRILPGTDLGKRIVYWLSNFKNKNQNLELEDCDKIYIPDPAILNDSRLLDIEFEKLIDSAEFESIYDSVVNHLNLPGKLIRYDFIKFWLENQCPKIKSQLEILIEENKI